MRDLIEEWTGVRAVAAFFGFAGGLLSLSVGGARTPLVAVACVFSGLFCSTAFTPVVREIWHYPDSLQSAVAFTLGVCGMNLVKFLHEKLRGETFSNIFSRWTGRGITPPPVDDSKTKK
jgi:hypothetical protein